jgi:endonuclease III
VPEQYAATDSRSGLAVTITGEFPPHPDDRVRIARTTNLFTRLMATILVTENETERRERFMAIETQLEMADALIRGDLEEVQRLLQSVMARMGVNKEQLDELARRIIEQFGGDQPPGDSPLFPPPN